MAIEEAIMLSSAAPTVERRNGMFCLAAKSGGKSINIAFSVHEAITLAVELERAVESAASAEIIPLHAG